MGKLKAAPKDGALTSRDWLGKAVAGLVLGFGLALALSSLFAAFGPQGLQGGGGKTQFNMWLMSPIWALTVSLVFLFRNGLRAWLWLGAANLAAFGLLYGLRAVVN